MTGGMAFMTFTLTFAGVIQTHLQRVMDIRFMEVQDQLELFFAMRLLSGIIVLIGVLMFLWATFGRAKEQVPPGRPPQGVGERR